MTVAELIAALRPLNPAMPVVVGGFDGWGYDSVSALETATVKQCNSRSSVAPEFDGADEQCTEGEEIHVLSLA